MYTKIKGSYFIELNRCDSISTITYDLDPYEINKNTLITKIKVSGDYLRSDVMKDVSFEKEIKVSFNVSSRNFNITDIVIEDFKYEVIHNAGIEVIYCLNVDYIDKDEIVHEEVFESPKTDQIYEEEDLLVTKKEEIVTDNEQQDDVDYTSIEDEEEIEDIIQEYEISEEDEILCQDEESDSSQYETDNIIEMIDKNVNEVIKNIASSRTKKSNSSSFIDGLSNTRSKKIVYFIQSEEEVEKIAIKHNISVKDIYRMNNYKISNKIIVDDAQRDRE